MEKNDIDSLYLGSFSPEKFINQGHTSALASFSLGLENIPTARVESACSSGAAAFKEAVFSVSSGKHDIVLVIGAEKMTDVSTTRATEILSTAGDMIHEGSCGVTFPGLFAMMANSYKKEYDLGEEDLRNILSSIAVKNHESGSKNEKAHLNHKITVEGANNSRLVASPLRLADCSPISDGAASVVICPSEMAQDVHDEPVNLEGFGHFTDLLPVHLRENLYRSEATQKAADEAFRVSDITRENLDFLEVHDCFTINEIIALESLGIFEEGKSAEYILNEDFRNFRVNSSGGLKSKGHPIGATGVGQIVECVSQMRGEVENSRQVEDPEYGLTHNMGGAAVSCFVNIFSRGF